MDVIFGVEEASVVVENANEVDGTPGDNAGRSEGMGTVTGMDGVDILGVTTTFGDVDVEGVDFSFGSAALPNSSKSPIKSLL